MMEMDYKITDDSMAKLQGLIDKITQIKVYVGIPEEKAARPGEPVNNAQLCYIHTNGSPVRKIPKRPIIEPAIDAPDNKAKITMELGKAAQAVLDGNESIALNHLSEAGQYGQKAARAWFKDTRNGWPPNTDATAIRKLKKLGGKKARNAIEEYLAEESSEALKALSTPLIDTGELRKSIVFLIKGPKE